MDDEIWKPIPGYEGRYEVSNLGRVRSLNYDRTGKPGILKCNFCLRYPRLKLFKNGKRKYYSVHRLVAIAFLPNPDNLPQVNHKDENPKNNAVDNLEWCDVTYNINYGNRNKRTAEKLKKVMKGQFVGEKARHKSSVICIETGKYYPTVKIASESTGTSRTSIIMCCRGKRKTAGGYHWRYADDEK